MPDATTISGRASLPATPPKDNFWPIFISYRRSELTREVALWLKEQLEKQTIEATTGQIFRLDVFVDAAEAHQSDFQANLVPHLEHSRALILLADDGAATRKQRREVDYLYKELDWWVDRRSKTPPVILQMDEVSGKKLTAEARFAAWRKVNFMDCFWGKWSRSPLDSATEKERLIIKVRESIRNYGQVIELEEVRRLKTRARIATGFGILALLAAVAAGVLGCRAARARDAAQQALTRYFVRAIGTTEGSWTPSGDEQEALWELATLGPENEALRRAVLSNWVQTPELLSRPLANNARGLHAAIGLKASLSANRSSWANAGATGLVEALEDPQKDFNRQLRLDDALAELAGWMDATHAAPVAEGLAKALERAQEKDFNRLSSLGKALATVVGRMDATNAAPVAGRGAWILAKALEDPQEKDFNKVLLLGRALAALAVRIDATNAAPVAEGLARALEDPQEKDSDRLSSLGQALAVFAVRMDATNAAPVAEGLARALKDPQEKDSNRLGFLDQPLAALAGRMDAANATPVAEGLAKALEDPQEKDSNRLRSLGQALAALARRMDATNAAPVAGRGALVLAKALEDPQEKDSYRLSILGEALAALARRMDATNAAPVAEGLARALEDPQEKDSNRLCRLGGALAALAGRMDNTNAAAVAERGAWILAKALEDPQEKEATDPRLSDHHSNRLSSLGQALAALAGRMDATNAAPVAGRGAWILAKALEDPQVKDFKRPGHLGDALAVLAVRMDAANAAPVAEGLARALEDPQEKDSNRLWRLGDALAALAGRMDATNAAAVAGRGAWILAKALEDPQEKYFDQLIDFDLGQALAALAGRMDAANAAPVAQRLAKALEDPRWKHSYRLVNLGQALAALAGRMDATNAAAVAERGACILAKALEDPQEKDSNRLWRLGDALAALAGKIPDAEQTQLAALSFLFLQQVSPPPSEGTPEAQAWTTSAKVCSVLASNDINYLVEVLKWPFCVGEAQKLVLVELEHRTGGKYGGDVWKFVDQARSRGGLDGINADTLELPPRRPKITQAIAKLQATLAANINSTRAIHPP